MLCDTNRVGGDECPWHSAGMSDYERIAKVIRYINEHREQQPNLDCLAAVAGLSASHFHRLFSRWAGITPKDFLKCLTLSDAKQRLREGNSVLDSAIESGLSGPGRLHDLCIRMEAATPGEIKTGGAGWIIKGGVAETPFGDCLVAVNSRGICHLSFFQALEFSTHWKNLEQRWPHASLERDDRVAGELCGRIFGKELHAKEPLKAYVKGTDFQVKVWQALLQVPEGQLVSYGHLARFVESPGASRAVGTAVGTNPIGFLIPCHRVIRETGAQGGYRWGTERKRAIQVWESQRSD
ncbi:methylated-DNA--[protein]-cysteine S-methyltransferase [Pontiellaceae bacterium B1224]|nr:methylated-DNA--[protein]-cysteine S-methyltransferase [Pontiellaceae bacterium B1224]